MKTKDLAVITQYNPLRSYSGILYLCDALEKRGITTDLMASVPQDMACEMEKFDFDFHNLSSVWHSIIPVRRCRRLFEKVSVLASGLKSYKAMLFTDTTYYPEAIMLKKLMPHKGLIHFNLELITPEEHSSNIFIKFYEKHAGVPDLILDVNIWRAELRKKRFNLKEIPAVIPNTLPRSAIPNRAPLGTLADLCGGDLPKDTPVLLYAGGVHSSVGFNTILEALEKIHQPFLFVAFCHGFANEVDNLRQECFERLGPERSRICNALPRSVLLSCLHEADAGLVCYPPSAHHSNNQLFCAPTKAYEYIAAGLPVIGSCNPTLIDLLEKHKIGICAKNDTAEAFRNAIEMLLFDNALKDTMRARMGGVFVQDLCYEVAAEPGIKRIIETVNRYA